MAINNFDLSKSIKNMNYTEDLYCKVLQTPSNCQSELVLRLAITLFSKNNGLLSENPFQHLNEIMRASSDLYNMSTSRRIIKILNTKFKENPKVFECHIKNLLKASANTQADSFLNHLLEKDLKNEKFNHLKLAYYKKNMTQEEYIDKLIQYLLVNFTDDKVWLELVEMYEVNLDFDKAIFCMEEILLLRPNDARIYIKLAELYFTLGSLPKFEIAKKYFCYVLIHQDDNLRALYGLKNTLEFIEKTSPPKFSGRDKKLLKMVLQKISDLDKF